LKGSEIFPSIGERKYVGKYEEEGEGKTGERFINDSVTWPSRLLITAKTSFRARLFL